jgi:hypothetical protein
VRKVQTIRKRLDPVASGFAPVTDTIRLSKVHYNLNNGLATKLYGKFTLKVIALRLL